MKCANILHSLHSCSL